LRRPTRRGSHPRRRRPTSGRRGTTTSSRPCHRDPVGRPVFHKLPFVRLIKSFKFILIDDVDNVAHRVSEVDAGEDGDEVVRDGRKEVTSPAET